MKSSGSAAGQQKQDLQRGLLVDAEGELKAAGADVVHLHLDLGQGVHHGARRGRWKHRADHQAELNALKHSTSPAHPAAW